MSGSGIGVALLVGTFTGYGVSSAPATPITQIGLDYLTPVKDDRQIKTTNLSLYLREKRLQSIPLSLKFGVVFSHATGQITQLTGTWEAGTLRSETLNSPGNGIGPAIEASLALWQGDGYLKPRVGLDFMTALMIYDRKFPAGGDRYNGTFQLGPSISLKPTKSDEISIGYRYTHTSNGQGLTPSNPGYDARGLTLRWNKEF